jgi:hypothetical protein
MYKLIEKKKRKKKKHIKEERATSQRFSSS